MIARRCVFSGDRLHRYTLWRDLSLFDKRFVQFIGLNPSTADEIQDDPTIRRCMDFASRWGYGALCMTNLFGFRATLPQVMKEASDPIGPDNMIWLRAVAQEANLIVAAWGVDGDFKMQSRKFLKESADWNVKIYCLDFTKSGQPKHPLYIAGNTEPKPFNFTS